MHRRNIGARSPRRKKSCSARPRSARGEIVRVERRTPAIALRCFAAFRFLALIALIVGTAAHGEQANVNDPSHRIRPFDIEAHRGGRALFPENTLVSFANGLSMGVNTLELDIGVTRDGVIVVSHERHVNPDLARGADGNYVAAPGTPFVRLSLDEVKQFDVGQIQPGSTYAAQFPQQHAVPGTKIPTLKELIDLVRRSGDTDVRLNIETKIDPNHPDESPDPERFVSLLLDLLRAEQFEDSVMVQSFDWRTLQLVQKLAPHIPTAYLTLQAGKEPTASLDQASVWSAGFNPASYGKSLPRTIKAAGGAIWSPYFRDVTPESIAESHALGLAVVVWTVNEPGDMGRLIAMGVDGIISDHPDVLRKVAAEKGIVLPDGFPVTP
jgi:glycerophosphoryl diester phosphodiesterase